MPLQPASGARDLNPKQVEANHILASKLSDLYRLWGYEQIDPPKIERLETLMADGGISSKKILKVVADEPLGLRPEMTASIVRGASSRFVSQSGPLRLWSLGTVFKCREKKEGGFDIEESLQSGIELIGIKEVNAEIELLSILLDAHKALDLNKEGTTTLLIGHTSLMKLLLSSFDNNEKQKIKEILGNFDLVGLNEIDIDKEHKDILKKYIYTRGKPIDVLNLLRTLFNTNNLIDSLESLFSTISPIAQSHDIEIQLDPSFETNYELYTGIFFQLVFNSNIAPNVIATGGRYDGLVEKFSKNKDQNYGVGFSFSIDKLRELKMDLIHNKLATKKVLIAYNQSVDLQLVLNRQRYWHKKGVISLIDTIASENKEAARVRLKHHECTDLEWIQR